MLSGVAGFNPGSRGRRREREMEMRDSKNSTEQLIVSYQLTAYACSVSFVKFLHFYQVASVQESTYHTDCSDVLML